MKNLIISASLLMTSIAFASTALFPKPSPITPNAGDYAICVAEQVSSETQIPYTEYGSYELKLADIVLAVTAHKAGSKTLASAQVLQGLNSDGTYARFTSSGYFGLEKGKGVYLLKYSDSAGADISIRCTKK